MTKQHHVKEMPCPPHTRQTYRRHSSPDRMVDTDDLYDGDSTCDPYCIIEINR